MRVLSVNRARSVWFVYLVDLNPHGLNLFSLIQPMINKYKFLQIPGKIEEMDLSKGVVFGKGSFENAEKKDISIDLTIFNDGFVADTRSSTKDSDDFLDEFLKGIAIEYPLIPYHEVIRSKIYLSELWIQSDKKLDYVNHKLTIFANRITSLIAGYGYHQVAYETAGIIFWTNPTTIPLIGPFRFERAEGVPFDENRYFSAAPLQTKDHLEMIEELERILSS